MMCFGKKLMLCIDNHSAGKQQ